MGLFAKHNLFDLFSDYSNNEVLNAIKTLDIDEQIILQRRYGIYYDGYKSNLLLSVSDIETIYGNIIPKIKFIMIENRCKNEFDCKDLIPCINSGFSNEYMCNKFNLTRQELYEELSKLRNIGISIRNKYYSNGRINYKFKNYIENGSSSETIITGPSENNMKLLAISDLHLCSYKERIDLLNKAFEYCTKNDINIILCCGDFIDGTFGAIESKIKNPYDQVDYFLNNYPHDDNILTFGVGGDHDYSAFKLSGIDIKEACKCNRSDIIIPDYNNVDINIKNDNIHLYHYINFGKIFLPMAPTFLCLHGHSHKYLVSLRSNIVNINIPSLSDISDQIPSIVEISFDFHKGYVNNLSLKRISIENEEVIDNAHFDLSARRVIHSPILNIDPMYKRKK